MPFNPDLDFGDTTDFFLPQASPTMSQLLFAGGIEFGSRATGYYNEDSDHDIAILESNYYNMFPKSVYGTDIKDIRSYMSVCPKGDCTIVRLEKLDILLLHDKRDLDIVAKAVTTTKTELATGRKQRSKIARIKIYEANLIKYGWLTNRSTKDILLELKASLLKKAYNVINNLRNKRYPWKT